MHARLPRRTQAARHVRIDVAGEQRGLKKQQARAPHRRDSAAEPRQHEPRRHGLDEKQQERSKRHGGVERRSGDGGHARTTLHARRDISGCHEDMDSSPRGHAGARLRRPAVAQAPARNVVVITLDGLRWQEMFTGANRDYFKKNSNGEPSAAEKRFWRETPEERRSVMMPFVWSTIATKGQIFGDPGKQSRAHVTNGLWFSYPGYNEMFAGAADPRVDSNDKVPNPNVTVLEWLNSRPGLQGARRGLRILGRAAVHPQHRAKPDSGRHRIYARAEPEDGSRTRNQRARDRPSPLLGLRSCRRAHGLCGSREPPH